ncbi:MAG: hypothetical protein CMI52_04155 [Parcubacteria group bacterium]|nr:hypothetical protein [Parcubacteria group bacterium]
MSLHVCYCVCIENNTYDMTTTLQIRVDEKLKKRAKKVFEKLGLDMTTAVKLYLEKAVEVKGVPFLLLTENGLTLEQEASIIQAAREAERGINTSPELEGDEVFDYLDSL